MGPLDGLRVIEMGSIGPAPFCGMQLADMGADVVRIDRPNAATADLGVPVPTEFDVLNRNKRSVAIDLKNADGIAALKALIAAADVLIEGFRPGVMERLGLGPEECSSINSRLVFGRMTGWGQSGPLAQTAAHDLNYIALTGALSLIGGKGQAPAIPSNLLGDFGGGALYLTAGVLAAHVRALRTGRGQVVDAAIVDGVSHLMAMQYAFMQMDPLSCGRGEGMLIGGAPYYGVYETGDGRYITIAAIEERFYRELLDRLGVDASEIPARNDRANWPALRARFAAIFRTRTREAWCAVFEGSDACFAPVLEMHEAPDHPHNAARGTFAKFGRMITPMPAPRFSETPAGLSSLPPAPGADSERTLRDWGFSAHRIEALKKIGAVQ